MFRRDQFGIVFNTIFSIFFSLALTAFIQFQQQTLGFENLVTGTVTAFAINFTLGSYIPLLKLGNGFAGLFVKEEKHPLAYFLRLFAIVFIMAACMCFLMMFLEMGFDPALFPALLFSFPPVFAFGYVAALLFFPLLLRATQALCTR